MAISFSKISRSRAGSSVAGSRQPRMQALSEDQRLAPLPVAAERGERLAAARHLLLVGLGGELLHGQQPFDERGGILERERGYSVSHSESLNSGR